MELQDEIINQKWKEDCCRSLEMRSSFDRNTQSKQGEAELKEAE